MAKKAIEPEKAEVTEETEVKPTQEELQEEINQLRLTVNDLILERDEVNKKLKRSDDMFGVFKEKYSEEVAYNAWFSLEVKELKEQLAAAKERIQQLESGTE